MIECLPSWVNAEQIKFVSEFNKLDWSGVLFNLVLDSTIHICYGLLIFWLRPFSLLETADLLVVCTFSYDSNSRRIWIRRFEVYSSTC